MNPHLAFEALTEPLVQHHRCWLWGNHSSILTEFPTIQQLEASHLQQEISLDFMPVVLLELSFSLSIFFGGIRIQFVVATNPDQVGPMNRASEISQNPMRGPTSLAPCNAVMAEETNRTVRLETLCLTVQGVGNTISLFSVKELNPCSSRSSLRGVTSSGRSIISLSTARTPNSWWARRGVAPPSAYSPVLPQRV